MKGKMLLIKNIEFLEVDRDPVEIVSTMGPQEMVSINTNDGPRVALVNGIREFVHGQRFRRPDGTEIIIGCSEQAAEVIGIQYEAWEQLRKDAADWHGMYAATKNTLNKVRELSFWERIRFAFTKKIPNYGKL